MPSMPTRQLGKNGPEIPRIGYGTMGLSISYGVPLSDEERFAILDHAHEIGETFWDTSDFYGDSEELLGKWFARTGKRSDVFLATKFGGVKIGANGFGFRGDAEYVSEACENSLKRLGIDYIDLWYPHRLDGSTPVEHIVAEMVRMKEQGKIRHLGLCEVSAETLRRAYAVHPIAAVQVEYSPFTTDIEENGLLAACRELGVAVVAYCPLSRGLLSGQIKNRDGFGAADVRAYYPRFSEENLARNLALVQELEKIAAEKGCTPGQLTLAWLLSQGDEIFPIPGTKNIKYLDENCAAANVELMPDEISRIRVLVDKHTSYGARYAPGHDGGLFSNTPAVKDYKKSKIPEHVEIIGTV